MATTAPNYRCTTCGTVAVGRVLQREAGQVTRWTVPAGWVLDVPPKPPAQGAKARCGDCI